MQDLTKLSDSLHPVEVFKLFIKSVFYIGKARQSRPYGHLKEASQMAKVRGRGGIVREGEGIDFETVYVNISQRVE